MVVRVLRVCVVYVLRVWWCVCVLCVWWCLVC